MRTFYKVVDQLETELQANPFVNTVSYGDIFDIDLKKQSLYPISHFIVNSATHQGSIWVLNISLLCMDLPESTDNEHHVLDEQLAVINKVIEKFKRGDLRDEKYELIGQPTATPFKDYGEVGSIGWECTFDIATNNTMGHEGD